MWADPFQKRSTQKARPDPICTADGIAGARTRDAIEKERALRGMPPDRRVGKATLPVLVQP